MSESNHRWRRKCCILALFALVIGLMGLTLPEQSILYNNYTNITYGGGGGVSFNGSSVDLNGSTLYNGSVPSDSLKVNKSGDNMTGRLNISRFNGVFNGYEMFGANSTPFLSVYENSTLRSELNYGGQQIWKLRLADSSGKNESGYIQYSTPGGLPGIVFSNSSHLFRNNIFIINDIYTGKKGMMINSIDSFSLKATGLLIDTADNITVDGLVGTGSDYVCVDANGKLFRANLGC